MISELALELQYFEGLPTSTLIHGSHHIYQYCTYQVSQGMPCIFIFLLFNCLFSC